MSQDDQAVLTVMLSEIAGRALENRQAIQDLINDFNEMRSFFEQIQMEIEGADDYAGGIVVSIPPGPVDDDLPN
jgi:hypothetical protein